MAGWEERPPSPVSEWDDPVFRRAGVRVWLKRDDLVHPDIPGNKWRKLLPNLREVVAGPVLTFGGAYSNHIRAVATAGRMLAIDTIGVIRGEPCLPLNWSLARAVADGMRLTYLDRGTYRLKHTAEVTRRLRESFGDFHVIPEGGSNPAGVWGARAITVELRKQLDVDVVCVPCGSGGTLAGIAAGLRPGQRAVGVAVLRGAGYVSSLVSDLQRETFGARLGQWDVYEDFHHGGFARRSPELDAFIAEFESRQRFRLEWVYVAKLLYAVRKLVSQGAFASGSRIVAVVTGPAEEPVTIC